MKTKGINTSEQIDAHRHNSICEIEKDELWMKRMIISCFTYGSLEKDSYWFNKYLVDYRKKLGDELFEEVYQEQSEFLSKCSIEHNVYTDGEGVTYNNLITPK